jgi:hypothetical protein
MAKISEKEIKKHLKPLSVALLDQAKNFYISVGQGITHWASMEGRLVQIAARLLKTSEEKAGIVFYSIININIWITIIDELFEQDGTYTNSMKAWRKLIGPLRKENKIRVRLAHHLMSQDEEDLGGTKAIQAYLRPGQLDSRAESKNVKPMTMVEIVEFTGRVGDLHDSLLNVLRLMEKRKSSR